MWLQNKIFFFQWITLRKFYMQFQFFFISSECVFFFQRNQIKLYVFYICWNKLNFILFFFNEGSIFLGVLEFFYENNERMVRFMAKFGNHKSIHAIMLQITRKLPTMSKTSKNQNRFFLVWCHIWWKIVDLFNMVSFKMNVFQLKTPWNLFILLLCMKTREKPFSQREIPTTVCVYFYMWFERKSKFFIPFNFFLWIVFSSWTNAIIHLHKNESHMVL